MNEAILQRLPVPRIKDQFKRKMLQKKRKDVDYKLRIEFFQKYLVVYERSAVKNSSSTYVCYAPDVSFWTVLYMYDFQRPWNTGELKRMFNLKINDKVRYYRIFIHPNIYRVSHRTLSVVFFFDSFGMPQDIELK